MHTSSDKVWKDLEAKSRLIGARIPGLGSRLSFAIRQKLYKARQ